MKRKITRKGIERKLQALVREIVIKRDGHCVTCPLWKRYKPDYVGSDILQAGHLLTRGKGSIKWDLRNIYCQCRNCNNMHQTRPEFLTSYALSVLGQEEYDKLVFTGNLAKPIKLFELVELWAELKNTLDK